MDCSKRLLRRQSGASIVVMPSISHGYCIKNCALVQNGAQTCERGTQLISYKSWLFLGLDQFQPTAEGRISVLGCVYWLMTEVCSAETRWIDLALWQTEQGVRDTRSVIRELMHRTVLICDARSVCACLTARSIYEIRLWKHEKNLCESGNFVRVGIFRDAPVESSALVTYGGGPGRGFRV